MMKSMMLAAGVCVSLLSVTSAGAATIPVAAGGNLQQAINTASAGDTIVLPAGATFTGSFTLPVKTGDAVITIRTAGDNGLPGDGGRVSPGHAGALAILRQSGSAPVVKTAAGAHHWRLMLLEVQGGGSGDLITLGDGSSAQTSLAQVPHHLTIDRLYIHGDAAKGQKRGIALNSASTTVTGSHISEIKLVGQDSQAICGWNGPGPFSITNNYLEAAGENIMFGGSDPAIPNLVPADITIADNYVTKRVSWRAESWSAKNLLELKNARRVVIVGNTFENNWEGGQPGFAIVFTVRNQDGRCPWCQVDHVTFERNVLRHSAAGIKILGWDNNHPSQQTQAIAIRNNVFYDLDSKAWGGNGYFVAMTDGARDITVDHNTVAQVNASGVVQIDGPPVLGFVYTNNLSKHGNYGIAGSGRGSGNDAIGAYLPGSVITHNVIAGGSAAKYPAGNSFPAAAQFETQFASYAGADFRLVANSAWRGAGTDGLDLGAALGGDGPTPTPRTQAVSGEGVITASFSGTACPAIQFMIGSYLIKATEATQFVGACGGVSVGGKVGVEGTLAADGSVIATLITVLDAVAQRPAAGRGTVTTLLPGSSCPALQFQIDIYTVSVDASTQFANSDCRSIAPGTLMDVSGIMTSDTTVKAQQISVVR